MFKRVRSVVAAIIGTSLLLTACSSEENETKNNAKATNKNETKQSIHLPYIAEIPTMDVTKATDSESMNVMRNVFEGLYILGEDNKVIPGVAKSYEVSDNKKTYTFHLRDSKWSNGTPVTAADFVYSWKRAVNPDTAAEYAFLFFDIKNAKKINSKELPIDQLGVKAIDDQTLEIQLEQPVPYFIDLTTFATFLPINEKYFESQGKQYGLEANQLVYNGAFTLDNWKHEQGFQLKKNPNYWDTKTVKLDEINFDIVKDKSTEINLYEAGQIDRVGLTGEFVDKYRNSSDFKERPEVTMQFLRMNQKNEVLKNKHVRLAISQAMNKKAFVDTVLNNGSLPADGFIPAQFAKGSNGKDFRKENGVLVKDDVKAAKENWKKAKQELGKEQVTLELLTSDNAIAKKNAEYLKGELEKNLEGLTVHVKPEPRKQQIQLLLNSDYDLGVDVWGPDIPDPITFLDLFTTDSTYNFDKYSNKQYDELIHQVKTDLAGNENARWEAMKRAEKILLEDGAVAPFYQSGRSYLQRSSIKGIVTNDFGGEFNYKWAEVKK
ncbi:oligopeptide ABC transporter, periplasmic oligopeptide-binding protein OppA (plasmid) [Bacillus thuringiensis serovar tolworthi]|uniref:Periplasmic oligopeptide-binding protein OppA n=1 Tax=Bacillus thuringiensis subsp. tolworthi TaxID=1442 RepID=A0A9W4A3S9_BACTO|nr:MULTISPECIES: peptide ABC transporter substrate-binding protein [Bacillus cereus group]MEB8711660.1 peptide ABC transporter substrate-binding protein [Bacillus cereus]MDR5045507.1 peptide ABC transporter substrate-binding protein [Bacillus thuringiensis]MEB8860546.1 peptide ABC transporter substrate-binding protein [Bacillus cereus]MEB9423108.1 peptide ABC transporter substrate-binding protein [Bacillus cereus]MEB9433248.1 peptide ABC transporter substrate-binding protein [Bacillus cereus]